LEDYSPAADKLRQGWHRSLFLDLSCSFCMCLTSDIEDWISESAAVGYNDDTSISCSSKNVNQLLKSLESEATRVLAYFTANKLVANAKKTKFLLIRGKNDKNWPESSVAINGEQVTESSSERILGVRVSNNLKWCDQYRELVNNLRYRIFTL
jgi:hypothetical protein